MKHLGLKLKVITLIFCLPGLAYGALRLGATRANLVKGDTTARVATVLKDSGVTGVEAADLVKALDNDIVEAADLNKILNNESGKLEEVVKVGIIKLIVAEADSTGMEALPGSKLKLEKARKKLVRLAVEVDGGSSHNQNSIKEISAAATVSYKAGDMPSETIAALETELAKTATAEAKAESERTGKSLLELFANCK